MQSKRILVWDLPVRLCHWLMVMAIVYAWYSIDIAGDVDQHFLAGYAALTLILFRILWGFFGSRYARFDSLLYRPSTTLAYSRQLFKKKSGGYAGHNPLGGLAAMVMISLILVQTLTGLFANDGYYVYGPLAEVVEVSISDSATEWHYLCFDILLILMSVHIAAIFYYWLVKRDNLIGSMVTGKKSGIDEKWPTISDSKPVLAITLFFASMVSVYAIAQLD